MSESTGVADILERLASESPENPEPAVTRADPPPPPEDDAAATADRLRQQLAQRDTQLRNTEAARVEAERRATEATTRAEATTQTAAEANFTTILSALHARTRESEALASEMKTAGESGDFAKVAELATKLGRVGASIEGLESAKQQMESDRNARLQAPPKAAPERAPVSDTTVGVPRETFLKTINPTVADWIRAHDQFFTDATFHQKCIAADRLVQADGILPSSPEYLSRVEGILGLKEQPQPRQVQRQSPPAGTPPARANPTLGGRPQQQNGDIYITPENRRVAEWLQVDPAGYQQEQDRLTAAGEIPHRRR